MISAIPTAVADRVTGAALALVPALAVIYVAFNAGGYFPNTQGLVATVALVALAGWIAFAEDAFGGLTKGLAVAIAAVAALAGWTMLSAGWSDSTSRALIESNRVLLYLATLALFGLIYRGPRRLQLLLWGLAGGIAAVCVAGLITRVLPDLWPIEANLLESRLSYPITYWNTLGLLASMGILISLHMATRAWGPRLARVLGAALFPVLASTLYFTFSRGAILVTIVGIAGYLLLARPRGTISGLAAVLPASAVAVAVAYNADLLATDGFAAEAAGAQGTRVAAVVLVSALVAAAFRASLLSLDDRLAAAQRIVAPRVALASVGAVAVVALVVALAAGAPSWVSDEYDRFVSDADVDGKTGGDARSRLTEAGSNGRVEFWKLAADDFSESELKGAGAGTFQITWERERPYADTVRDAHSLYLETLGELGLVGLALLLLAVGTILYGVSRQVRGEFRTLYAVVLAICVMWALRAGIDWDWEMPVVTLVPFALGGAALAAARVPGRYGAAPPRAVRLAAAGTVALLAFLPWSVFSSQSWLDRAETAFGEGDCELAAQEARNAVSALGSRPEPYELLGYCAIREGDPQQAVAYMEDAVDRDPRNWNFHYGLGLAHAAAGIDPRPELETANEMNPLGPLTVDAVERFETDDAQTWKRRATSLARRLTSL